MSAGNETQPNTVRVIDFKNGVRGPDYADRISQDKETGSFLRSLPRYKRPIFASVLGGLALGTLSMIAGGDSADASDDRTQHTFEPQNQSVKTIDNFDGFDGPLGNPYQDLDFDNHLDMHAIAVRANHNLDLADQQDSGASNHASEGLLGDSGHENLQTTAFEKYKLGDKLAITIDEGSSVDGEIQEKFGLTPEQSWSVTSEFIDGDTDGYHWVNPGELTFELDEGDVSVLDTAGIASDDSVSQQDAGGTQSADSSASAHNDDYQSRSGDIGGNVHVDGFSLTAVNSAGEATVTPTPSIEGLGGIPDEATPTPFPTPTATPDIGDLGGIPDDDDTSTPSVPSNEPEPTTLHPTDTPTPTPTPSYPPESPTPHVTDTPTPTPSATPTPSPTPSFTPSPTPELTPSYPPESPSPHPTDTPTPTPTPSYPPESPTPHVTDTPTPTPTPEVTLTPVPPLEEFQLIVKKRLDANRNSIFDKDDIPLDQRVQVWIDEDRDRVLDGEEGVMSFNLGTDGVEAVTFSMTQNPEGLQVCAEEPLSEIDADLEPVIAKDCDVVDESRITEVRLLNRNKEVEVTPTPTPVPSETPVITPAVLPPTGGFPGGKDSAPIPLIIGGLLTVAAAGAATALAGANTGRLGWVAEFMTPFKFGRKQDEDEEEEKKIAERVRRQKIIDSNS